MVRKKRIRRMAKSRITKRSITFYLVLLVICYLVAAAISSLKTKAPEIVENVVSKQIARRASEMGVEGVDEQTVKTLLKKHSVDELVEKYNETR